MNKKKSPVTKKIDEAVEQFNEINMPENNDNELLTADEELIEESDEIAAQKPKKRKTNKKSDSDNVPNDMVDSLINSATEADLKDFAEELAKGEFAEKLMEFLSNKKQNLAGKDANEAKELKNRKKRASRNINIQSIDSRVLKPIITEMHADQDFSISFDAIPSQIPVLPLKDFVVYNSMIVPLHETRSFALEAIDEALATHRMLFLCTQKKPDVENPKPEELYDIGVVVMVLRMVRPNDGQAKLLIQGLSRARAQRFLVGDQFLSANIELMQDENVESEENKIDKEALIRLAREQSEKILHLRGIPLSDIMSALNSVNAPGKLADIIATNMRLDVADGIEILKCLDPLERLRKVNTFLAHEIEIATMQEHIQGMARDGMDKAQKDYYLREQLKAIRNELGERGSAEEELESLQQALKKAQLPKEVQKEADKQFKRLATMNNDSSEASVIRTYLEWLADLPWKKSSKDVLDILKAKQVLDEDHYGLEKIKDRILEFLSVRKLNPNTKGSILCFAGPPGVGKTSLGKSIARSMGRKFQRFSLGGMRDEAEIRGHRRTYIGAMPGRLIQALKQAGTRNPVILLDEIDKLASDYRGDPSSALLEVLDPEQNVNFSDHYLNVPFDLSKVLFICTANHLENIPSALRDRLEIISLSGYTEQEKLAISEKYLVPKQVDENGLKKEDVKFSKKSLEEIIHKYTREAGLRNLEREIGSVCRKLARKKAEGSKAKTNVTPKLVEDLLGIPRYLDEEKDMHLQAGVAQGLAWTQVGGEVLYVEVSTMKGKGTLTLTGQLGDVMKESATAALSYARAHAKEWGIEEDFNEKLDIHIHVPAGATPKDGPSAGVTITSALISALINKSVRADVCMTGEITLRGRVLPVGGIKEKLLAAVARGLKQAVIPAQNKKDIEEIPEELRKKIKIHTVSNIDDLLAIVFEK